MKKLLSISSALTMLLLLCAPLSHIYAQEAQANRESTRYVRQSIRIEREEIEAKRSQTRDKIESRLSEIQKGSETIKKQSDEDRKKSCADRKKGLETKLSKLQTNAQKHQDRISTFLAKIKDYKNTNNISSQAIDDAISKAGEAKTTSAASVEALKDLKVTVECENKTVATDVATFKAASEQARKDLKDYRSAVKAIYKVILNEVNINNESKTESETRTGGQ